MKSVSVMSDDQLLHWIDKINESLSKAVMRSVNSWMVWELIDRYDYQVYVDRLV